MKNQIDINKIANSMPIDIQVEHAHMDMAEMFQTSVISKISLAEIAALGGAFSGVAETFMTPMGEGVYRCIFPKGVTGTLAMAKDGSGALGTIINESGIVGQARWQSVGSTIGLSCIQTTLVAVAIFAVAKQIHEIKDGQKEIIDILERDKKSQLLTDYNILLSYMEDYRYYWNNEIKVTVNLNQVENIERNARKDICSYTEQIEELLVDSKGLHSTSNSKRIQKIFDRFAHYKLALYVDALAKYMDVVLSRNFQQEYLDKVLKELHDIDYNFRELYTRCYDKIERLKKEALSTVVAGGTAKALQSISDVAKKVPIAPKFTKTLYRKVGENMDDSTKKQLEEMLNRFIQFKESGICPFKEHIEKINLLSNKPIAMIYDHEIICFKELQKVV